MFGPVVPCTSWNSCDMYGRDLACAELFTRHGTSQSSNIGRQCVPLTNCQSYRIDFREPGEDEPQLASHGKNVFVDCGGTVCNYDSVCTKCLELNEGRKCRDGIASFWDTDFELYAIKEFIDLPGLGVNPQTVTFSGYASGSYMANAMHVAYSETIKGAGLICGGPYR